MAMMATPEFSPRKRADGLDALHFRHYEIGDHEIDGVGANQAEHFSAVGGFEDFVTGRLQDGAEKAANGRLVIGDHDAGGGRRGVEGGANPDEELGRGEGFAQDPGVGRLRPGVARHEQHTEAGPPRLQAGGESPTGHPGHDCIGEEQVNGAGNRLGQGEGGFTVPGLHDAVSLRGKDTGGEFPELWSEPN